MGKGKKYWWSNFPSSISSMLYIQIKLIWFIKYYFKAKYEQEKEKNATLTKELEIAHKELAIVKARNATLCSLLSQGESKHKFIKITSINSS